MLRQPVESTQYTSTQFQALLTASGITCSMSKHGVVPDIAAMENSLPSPKIERTRGRVYRSTDEVWADMFDNIKRCNNPKRCNSALGYLSPVDFEKQTVQAQLSEPLNRQQLNPSCVMRYRPACQAKQPRRR